MSESNWTLPRVGDRVRVRPPVNHTCEDAPHFLREDGVTGWIAREEDWPYARSHGFLVYFDASIHIDVSPGRAIELRVRHYAATELQVLG